MSFVTFAVEHDDTTDSLIRFISEAHSVDPSGNDTYSVIDYSVKVDVKADTLREIQSVMGHSDL